MLSRNQTLSSESENLIFEVVFLFFFTFYCSKPFYLATEGILRHVSYFLTGKALKYLNRATVR